MGVGSDDHSVDMPVSSVVQHATAVQKNASRIFAATVRQEPVSCEAGPARV